jgi:hypothetical protein
MRRDYGICSYTAFLFDQEPARQLRPNPCHRAFVLHPSACCFRLLPMYQYVHSPARCFDPRHHAIYYYTMTSRSTRNQRGYCCPILVAVPLYRILQLAVFDCCPFTLASTVRGATGIQGIMPSITTLFFRLTWNQRAAIAPQFLSTCVCTAFFSLLSSNAVHLLPLRGRCWDSR